MRVSPIGYCAAVLVALTALALGLPHETQGWFGIGFGVALDRFVAITCLQGVVYAVAVWLLLRGGRISLPMVLGVAVLLRVMVLSVQPFLSNDMYRYIWDGWVQAHGINPYAYIPADPHLAFLRDAVVYPNINRADYAHTIYPPGAEVVFLIVSFIGKLLAVPPVLMMRLAMVSLEAVGMFAMLRLLRIAGLPGQRILIYAWNPLPVWQFAGNGHVDAIAVCFVALALWAACAERRAWSAAALAMAVLAKFLPVVLLPVLWRRWDWKFAALFVAMVLVFYAPFLGVGLKVFGFLGGYAAEEHLDTGQGIFLASLLGVGVKVYFAALALVLMGMALAMLARPETDVMRVARRAGMLMAVLMLGLSPHYAWYYAWLLIPAVITASPALIWVSCASFVLVFNPLHTGLLWPAVVFGPFLLLELLESKASASFLKKRSKKLLSWGYGS